MISYCFDLIRLSNTLKPTAFHVSKRISPFYDLATIFLSHVKLYYLHSALMTDRSFKFTENPLLLFI